MTNTVATTDGARIALDRSGTGPPLIGGDGAPADQPVDRSLVAALAPHFSVFAGDRWSRSNGGGTSPFAIVREIEDLDAITAEAASCRAP